MLEPTDTGAGIPLGVLDQSPVSEGRTGADSLRETVELARHAESLGYGRYWVAEHHGGPLLAGASPEVLVAQIAGATTTLRVGSGGVMLPHYSPVKVAETFSILAALHPGRIDLGVGRAAGTDPMTAYALQRDRREAAPDDFPEQLGELVALLRDRMPEGHPFARLAALPGGPERPALWMLGSSPQSAIWAAELGLPYAFADFINPEGAEPAAAYRSAFRPSSELARPSVAVAVSAICAETDEEARRLGASITLAMRMMRRGRPIPVPPPDAAARALEREGSAPRRRGRRRMIVGSPATVRAGIEGVAAAYAADEVLVVTITHDPAARRRSYELIAEAMGVRQPARPAPSAARRGPPSAA